MVGHVYTHVARDEGGLGSDSDNGGGGKRKDPEMVRGNTDRAWHWVACGVLEGGGSVGVGTRPRKEFSLLRSVGR